LVKIAYDAQVSGTATVVSLISNEPAHFEIQGDNATYVSSDDNFYTDYNFKVTLRDGQNDFSIIATDNSGNSSGRDFSISAELMNINLLLPQNLQTSSASITVKYSLTSVEKIISNTVNGQMSEPLTNGQYQINLPLVMGKNPVTITATATAGVSRSYTFEILRVAPPLTGYRIPVLMYHHVGGLIAEADNLPADKFEAQLKYLQSSGYTTVTFAQLADQVLRDKKITAKKPIILSFDDGYIDNYQYAFPLLKKYSFRGSFAIVTGMVGGDAHNTRWYMNWDELSEMSQAGMEIDSHTVSHRGLAGLDNTNLKAELLDSKNTLEQKLGIKVNTIVYPYGSQNQRVITMAASLGYELGRLDSGSVAVVNKDDLFLIPRVRISSGTKLSDFKLIIL
jgi:peptidoglycan/xylan/chitin deacetylase (PgdA/CDA1 family)